MRRKTVCLATILLVAAALMIAAPFTGQSENSALAGETFVSDGFFGRGASGDGDRPGLGLLPSRPDPEFELEGGGETLGAGRLAASVDLTGTLPPIGNQGAQGSCVGWAAGYYYKTWWEKQEHSGWDLSDARYQYSPSFIYNQINGGVDYGSTFEDAFELLQTKGDVDIEEFPYSDSDYWSQPTSSEKEAAKQYKIPSGDDAWGYFFKHDLNVEGTGPFNNPINGLKSHLASGEPLVMGIPVFDDFPDYADGGGGNNPKANCYASVYDEWNQPVFFNPPYGNFWGGHAVYIAGYNDNANPGGGTADERGGFLMVNSWGSGWNYSGEVYLSYKFVKDWVWEAWKMTDDRDSSPSITGINPPAGGPGQVITVEGTNLGSSRRSAKVRFPGGRDGTAVSWTNSQIKVQVPSGAGTGSVYVYDWDGEKSNGKNFTGDSTAGYWMLAEGATWPGFDEWVLVQNPNSTDSIVEVTFLTPDGEVPGPGLTVPAQSRTSIHVNDYVPNADVATVVAVTNDVQICAERAMYVSTTDGKWGSHDSIGSRGTSSVWYLAEGATWPGFDEWVLVMNPYPEPVSAQVTFQTSSGELPGPQLELPGGSRASVHVNDHVPNEDVSTKVECLTEGKGVVAERSMYMSTADGKRGCHNSLGQTESAAGWGLAEGATWPGFEEWVLVQNPSAVVADVEFYFLNPEGVWVGPTFSIDPGSRISVRVNDYMPDEDVSTMVLTAEEEQKVVVERAMYMNTPDGKQGAHNAPGSVYASGGWYLPEGCTWPGFDEWVLVMNPDPESSVEVNLTFMTPEGAVYGPTTTIAPGCRESFHVNDYVTGDVSTRVASDGYVVCERAMYVASGDGKRGSHDSLGVIAAFVDPETPVSSASGNNETTPFTRPIEAFSLP